MQNFYPNDEILSIVKSYALEIESIEKAINAKKLTGGFKHKLPDANALIWSSYKGTRGKLIIKSLTYRCPFIDAPIEDQLAYGRTAIRFLTTINYNPGVKDYESRQY